MMGKPYPEYKHSGIEWLGEIPAHWEVKRLKYVADIASSNVDKKSVEGENPVQLCNYVDVYKNEFITSEIDFMPATATVAQVRRFTLFSGDVLITKDSEDPTDIAVPAYVRENHPGIICGYHLARVRPVEIEGSYLFRLFQTEIYQQYFYLQARGITRFGLSLDAIYNVLAFLPPLPEQRAIAAYLDRKTQDLDELIADKRRLIELYQEERSALINRAVTRGLDPDVLMKDSGIEWLGEIPRHWEVKRLKYVTSQITGGGTPATGNPAFWNGEIPWVSPKDMKFDRITSSQDYITEEAVQESAVKWVPVNSVLIVVRSGILKHSFPVAVNDIPVTLNQDMKAFSPSHKILPEYLWYLFKGLSSEVLIFCSKVGATVDSIEMELLINFLIAIPSVEEQGTIIEELNEKTTQLDQQLTDTEREIELLQEYRTALISEVVTGKVDVRGGDDI